MGDDLAARMEGAARDAVLDAPVHHPGGKRMGTLQAAESRARAAVAAALLELACDINRDGSTGRLIKVSDLRALANHLTKPPTDPKPGATHAE